MATMFERYGGFATIRRVVSSFYDKVLDSDQLSHHFAHTDMRRLIEHQTQFISYLTDGPGLAYSNDMLRRVHGRLGVTAEEFAEMVALLRETLEDHDFDEADVAVVVERIREREPLIVRELSPR